ncbi:MAG TPA: DUF2024 family protein [Edaphocola sp.]|nr:DUF2024 family protein [Edaphocola sp.]
MEISVYDTVFKKEDGTLLKFDILVPSNLTDLKQIYEFGNSFLKSEKIKATTLISADECTFCHLEVATRAIEDDIKQKGYSIFKHWGFTTLAK